MPKMKLSKTVRDRFKVSSNGKVLRRKIGQRHLKASKSRANVRRGKIEVQVVGVLEKKVKKLLMV
ncbi:50S ribosomal protein L35 [Candidatus Microgenomates bacterium]|nr:50S ribosomal protein L35 [Candidatus Microgenomates bacterium]